MKCLMILWIRLLLFWNVQMLQCQVVPYVVLLLRQMIICLNGLYIVALHWM